MIKNKLVPKHELLNAEEAEAILGKYRAVRDEFPKIRIKDPAIAIFDMKPKLGDIVRITRENKITGTSYYYRVVIDG